MKSTLTIIVLFFTINLSAQIERSASEDRKNKEIGKLIIGERLDQNGQVRAQLVKYSKIEDELGKKMYTLLFRNAKYKKVIDLKSVSFYATDNDLDLLFDEFALALKNQEKRSIKLGNETLYYEPFVKINLIISAQNAGGFFYITDIDLHNLFGKTYNKKTWKKYLKS